MIEASGGALPARNGSVRAATSLVLIALGVTMLSGCSVKRHLHPASLHTMPPPAAPAYTIGAGDTLTIKFYYNPELNEDVLVRPDGKISLQLIGEVTAAGQAPAALAGELTKKYARELAAPNVSVIVRSSGGGQVFVSGEVGKQGAVPLSQGLTLYQAIQQAGGLLTTAHRKQIILIRRQTDGQPAGAAIDIRPIESGEQPEDDVPLRPLDMVFVPRSKIGDVNVFVDLYVRRNMPNPPFAIPLY